MPGTSSRFPLAAIALLAALGCSESTAPAGSTDGPSASILPVNAIPVSRCGTFITAPGDYWLTKDLLACRGPFAAIRIDASGAILHLNWHRVLTVPGSRDIAIELIGDNATVLGPGFVNTGNMGILIDGSNNQVRGVTVLGYDQGIYVAGGTGNLIEDVIFRGGYAALSSGGTGTIIRHNTVTGPAENGFLIYGSGELIDSNQLEAAGWAIMIAGDQDTVSNNRIIRSGTGILVAGVGNLITGNLLRHNGEDLVDWNADACLVNTWINNQFSTAYPDCLQ